MKKLFTFLIIFSFFNTYSQSFCATQEALADHDISSDLSVTIKKNQQNIYWVTVPVIFYIYNYSQMGVAETQEQLDILNAEFGEVQEGDFHIRFCLATTEGEYPLPMPTGYANVVQHNDKGLFWIYDESLPPFDPTVASQVQNLLLNPTGNLDGDRYLRIFVIENSFGSLSSIIPPYLSNPDKYIILHTAHTVGNQITSTHNTGKVLVHEVGHYFGLFHVFQMGCSGSSPYNCTTDGDKVCDTPPMLVSYGSSCSILPSEECTGYTYGPRSNHMDYKDDVCRNDFSPGQWNVLYTRSYNEHATMVSQDNMAYTNPYCEDLLCEDCDADKNARAGAGSLAEMVSLYPNPTDNGQVTLAFNRSIEEDVQVVVYDLSGSVIVNESYKISDTQDKIDLDFKDLNSGLYHIKIVWSNGENTSLRFIK